MIKIKNLHAGYNNNTVLKGIDLCFAAGEQVALLGPNGAGKSTLLNCLSGYLRPYKGNISIADKAVEEYRKKDLAKKVALIPQNFHLQFEYQVKDLVLMGRFPYIDYLSGYSDQDREIVKNTLIELDLEKLKNKNFNELSGGEQQRTAIARALVQDTPVLLMDEAFANLDVNHAISIMQLLSKINKRHGKTIVLVSHNINLAVEYCHRAVLLKEGEIIRQGSSHDVITEDILREVYGQKIRVITNPVSGLPNLVYSL